MAVAGPAAATLGGREADPPSARGGPGVRPGARPGGSARGGPVGAGDRLPPRHRRAGRRDLPRPRVRARLEPARPTGHGRPRDAVRGRSDRGRRARRARRGARSRRAPPRARPRRRDRRRRRPRVPDRLRDRCGRRVEQAGRGDDAARRRAPRPRAGRRRRTRRAHGRLRRGIAALRAPHGRTAPGSHLPPDRPSVRPTRARPRPGSSARSRSRAQVPGCAFVRRRARPLGGDRDRRRVRRGTGDEPVHLDRRAARRSGHRDRRDRAGAVDGQARGGRSRSGSAPHPTSLRRSRSRPR